MAIENESAEDTAVTLEQLIALHMKNTTLLQTLGRSAKTSLKVFAYLEANPIIEIKKTAVAFNVSFNTAAKAVANLERTGIVEKTGKISRNRTFAYTSCLDILRRGT